MYVGTLDRWAYHIRGLCRIAHLRGGFYDLNEELRLFACWFDVLGSVAQDNPPALPDYQGSSTVLSVPTRASHLRLHGIFQDLAKLPAYSSCLISVLQKMDLLADFVNANYQNPRFWKTEDDLTSLQMLGPVTHELLAMPRYERTTLDPMEIVCEMTRLVLLILLAGLKAKYGFLAVEAVVLQRKFTLLLERTAIHNISLPLSQVQMWALLTVAMLQPAGQMREFYLKEIIQRMFTMDIVDSASAIGLCREILWIEIFAQDFKLIAHEIGTIAEG